MQGKRRPEVASVAKVERMEGANEGTRWRLFREARVSVAVDFLGGYAIEEGCCLRKPRVRPAQILTPRLVSRVARRSGWQRNGRGREIRTSFGCLRRDRLRVGPCSDDGAAAVRSELWAGGILG